MALVDISKVFHGAQVISYKGVELGYSVDGVRPRLTPLWNDIHSDDRGGYKGPPCDSQLMGAIASISVQFNKADQDELDALTSFGPTVAAASYTDTPGVIPSLGSFAIQDGLAGDLVLAGSGAGTKTITFYHARIVGPLDFLAGSQARDFNVNWETWLDSGATRRIMSLVNNA